MEHFYKNIQGYSTFEKQGELLNKLLKVLPKKPLKIAEIGVFKGRCTAMWNVELINNNIEYVYYAIDHFLGSDEHQKNIDYFSICKKNLDKISDNINLIKNNSLDEVKNYDDEFFDIVYIDASHDYNSVKKDILAWLPKVKINGIICGDDYVPEWEGVKKAVNETFKKFELHNYQWWFLKK